MRAIIAKRSYSTPYKWKIDVNISESSAKYKLNIT